MTRLTGDGPNPAFADHGDYASFEPVRDLADRAARHGAPQDVDKMLARAEEKLAELRTEFPAWMAQEYAELETCWKAFMAGEPDGQKKLFRKAHDMRGQASTFGYPLAGRAADSLCKLFDALETVPHDVVGAHVMSIKVIVRENVNTDDHPLGAKMIEELDKLSYGLIRKALSQAT
jgi:hypothetical protein